MSSVNGRYNVGGVYLPRPFKVRRLGHFGFNVEKLPEGREFYGDLLGFTASDTLDFSRAPWYPKDTDLGDPRGYFMRYGTDHHAFVLFPKKVMDHRADRKFAPEVTINQITWQCGSLQEITDAHAYFQEQQVRVLDPRILAPSRRFRDRRCAGSRPARRRRPGVPLRDRVAGPGLHCQTCHRGGERGDRQGGR